MRGVAVVVVLLLLAPALVVQSAPDPSGTYVSHAPIRIRTDADFNATNGVVGGTGTPADPYVIAGWDIQNDVGAGIRIENVSKSFVVRDNLVRARTGVQLVDMSAETAVVSNNAVVTRYIGIEVHGVAALVVNNSILLDTPAVGAARGIYLHSSNARVETNYILTFGVGIEARQGSPVIVGNDIHAPSTGILLTLTTSAHVDANIVTDPMHSGIYVTTTITTSITANLVNTSWGTGIESWVNKDVLIANNSVRLSLGAGVLFESSSGVVDGNVVVDGRADAVVVWHSPLFIVNNTIDNNLGVGLHFSASAADAEANLIVRNGLGVHLATGDVVRLSANVFANNTVGISIPYEARQSIVHMEANIVNGVNVDGSLDASQRVFFYKAANVTIEGQVRDSGFSAGFYGSLTAQGGVVLYEVDTANVNASVISHHNVGVGVVNSFNVNVRGSLLANNGIGVRAEARLVAHQVPACVVFVKDTNVTIDVDPPATVGIETRGCATFTVNATVSVVDVGIRATGAATIGLANTTVVATSGVGLDLSAGGVVNVSGGVYAGNRVGIRAGGGTLLVADANVTGNADAGIRLEGGAHLKLLRSNVSSNGVGVTDVAACLGPGTCGSVETQSNVLYANAREGIRVNGTSTLRGDLLAGNGRSGAALGAASLIGVRALGNGEDGASVAGAFTVRDSAFDGNFRHGFMLIGEGSLRNATFRENGEAGIRARATYVTAFELDVSDNFDGILFEELVPGARPPGALPGTSIPGLLQILPTHVAGGNPLDVHLSRFLDNRRDAIRAGGALVNASHNYWGPLGPTVNVGDTLGAYQNGVSPTVRTVPFYTSPDMDEAVVTMQDAPIVPTPTEPGPSGTAVTVFYDDFSWCASSCPAAAANATNLTQSSLAGVAYGDGGAAAWSVVGEGIDGNGMAARSGAPGPLQSSDLVVRFTVPDAEAAGFFYEFRWKARGKAENATVAGDVFRLNVERIVRDAQTGDIVSADSVECMRTTGSADWTTYDSRRLLETQTPALCAHLPPGEYALRFRHERDGGAALPDAGAWLDHLKLDRRPQLG